MRGWFRVGLRYGRLRVGLGLVEGWFSIDWVGLGWFWVIWAWFRVGLRFFLGCSWVGFEGFIGLGLGLV